MPDRLLPSWLAMKKTTKSTALETTLGHRFKDRALLKRALTHASARTGKTVKDNERLEFLGDRVLGLAIAELLCETFPEASEGDLARRFNRLVRGGTCAAIGRNIKLGPHIILSGSEAESGGRDKDTILADAVEALLGAVLIEAGYDAARTIIRTLWAGELEKLPAVSVDAKSALQEWAQGRGLELPDYMELERSGPDHAPRFLSEVRIKGCKPASGEGTSKRAAEQAAAMAFLSREGVWKAHHG
ncbi:MAG: ribonuclease III [Hyphomicrobiaceae bacterium]